MLDTQIAIALLAAPFVILCVIFVAGLLHLPNYSSIFEKQPRRRH